MLVSSPPRTVFNLFRPTPSFLPSNNQIELHTTVNATKSARLIAEIPIASSGQRGSLLLPLLLNLATNHLNASENLPPQHRNQHERHYPARSKRGIEYSTTPVYHIVCD